MTWTLSFHENFFVNKECWLKSKQDCHRFLRQKPFFFVCTTRSMYTSRLSTTPTWIVGPYSNTKLDTSCNKLFSLTGEVGPLMRIMTVSVSVFPKETTIYYPVQKLGKILGQHSCGCQLALLSTELHCRLLGY